MVTYVAGGIAVMALLRSTRAAGYRMIRPGLRYS